MPEVKQTIVNELGNSIDFRITDDSNGITVFASGLHSEVEHTWTLMEAYVLRDMLTDLLPH